MHVDTSDMAQRLVISTVRALSRDIEKAESLGTGPRLRSGAEESRTPDLIIANDALYQLSYRPGIELSPERIGRRREPRGRV